MVSVKCSDLRASPPLLSPFCSLSRHCEASGGFYYRGDLIKAQHFDDFAAASLVCVCDFKCFRCVCLRISSLLSFSLSINVRALVLRSSLTQTGFKGRMKAVDSNIHIFQRNFTCQSQFSNDKECYVIAFCRSGGALSSQEKQPLMMS